MPALPMLCLDVTLVNCSDKHILPKSGVAPLHNCLCPSALHLTLDTFSFSLTQIAISWGGRDATGR